MYHIFDSFALNAPQFTLTGNILSTNSAAKVNPKEMMPETTQISFENLASVPSESLG
jgi:hypothetical protein